VDCRIPHAMKQEARKSECGKRKSEKTEAAVAKAMAARGNHLSPLISTNKN